MTHVRGYLFRARSRTPGRSAVITRAVVTALVVAMGWSPSPTRAYRFIALESVPIQFPTVTPPSVWDPDVWGPGETLSFVLVDEPGWDASSTDIQDIKDTIEAAMRAWERVPGADIRWSIGETVPGDDLEGFDEDTHYLSTRSGSGSVTVTMFDRGSSGVWKARRVHILMGEEHIADPYSFRYAILHELGHAVGLDHASVYSRGERPDNIPGGLLAGSWRFDPVMSYGRAGQDRFRDYDSMLTPDDRVGASLLRPRDGWLESTGNIRGTVVLDDGEGAGLVHVLATRVRGDGSLDESVGAFTNALGEFVIGGLDPGDYALLVRALEIERAHPKLLPWLGLGIRDTIWAVPITVRAGARAGPVTVVVTPGDERPGR